MTWLEAHGWLTLWQRDGDDDAVSGSYPQAVAGDHQSGDPHEREAQLTGACDTHSISRLNGTAGLSNAVINTALTQHLADVRLDVNILQVLVCVRVEEPEGRVQTNGHPDTVAIPRQLPHLTLLTRMSVERFLCVRNSRPISSRFITCKGDSWAGISMSCRLMKIHVYVIIWQIKLKKKIFTEKFNSIFLYVSKIMLNMAQCWKVLGKINFFVDWVHIENNNF